MVPTMHFPGVFFTLLTAFVVPLASCTPFHTRNPVTFEVIDGLTGRPVAGANIAQSVQTGKFGRQLHAEANAADDGMATINTFGGASPSYWTVNGAGPTYLGVGYSQIPPDFTRITERSGAVRYIAPSWPSMYLRIKLPEGYRGLVVEWPAEFDVPRSSGWMPPMSVEPGQQRRAVAAANEHGVVAPPTSIGGIAGFQFVPERWLMVGGTPINRINDVGPFTILRPPTAEESATVRVWEIGYEEPFSFWTSKPQGTSARVLEPLVWFFGSEHDLREWVRRNSIVPMRPDAAWTKVDILLQSRVFTKKSLFAVITKPTEPTAPPQWDEVAEWSRKR